MALRHLPHSLVGESRSPGFQELTTDTVLRVREDRILRPVAHNVVLGRWKFDRLVRSQVCEMVLLVELIDRNRRNLAIVKL